MKKELTFITTSLFFTGIFISFTACAGQIKEVYIPVKCEVPERVKPQKNDFIDFTDFSAALRAYYKGIEQDLYFCRTGKKVSQTSKHTGKTPIYATLEHETIHVKPP